MPCQACKEFKEKHVRYKAKTVTIEEMKILGFDPDYSVLCTITSKPMPCPNGGLDCGSSAECPQGTCPPPWACPPPPKPNSHYVSDTCHGVISLTCIRCVLTCREIGTCVYAGNCYYDCDPPHVWNGFDCVLPAVSEPLMDGFMYID